MIMTGSGLWDSRNLLASPKIFEMGLVREMCASQPILLLVADV
jgi:hypothetical protein